MFSRPKILLLVSLLSALLNSIPNFLSFYYITTSITMSITIILYTYTASLASSLLPCTVVSTRPQFHKMSRDHVTVIIVDCASVVSN